jgi:SAM-dependent methyltransferase
VDEAAPDYAFPHAAVDEDRRLELFQQRLDPLTLRRLRNLGPLTGARCLEVGGGRGSIAACLADIVGPAGHVTVTDLQTGLLERLDLPNVTVLRHDVRTDAFPPGSFDLVHVRAVLMHVERRLDVLRRLVSWLAPGGWLLAEEPDFGMWMADLDPLWAAHPPAWHEAFPHGSLAAGRFLLRQGRHLGLVDVGADAELDVVAPGTPLAEFYRLSLAALAEPTADAGALTRSDADELARRPTEPDFLSCGFAFIGIWGRRPSS